MTVSHDAAPLLSVKKIPSANIKVRINSLETSVPEFVLHQEDVIQRARKIFGSRTKLFSRLEPSFFNAKIQTRYTCLSDEWFEKETSIEEKYFLFQEHATSLAEAATYKALNSAQLTPQDIDGIVFISSTGVATPGIDARLLNHIPFRNSIARLPIFGLGCAGGVIGVTRAVQLAKALPGSRILVIVLELCTLAFRYDKLSKSNMIATALFGDGAAAIIIESGHFEGPGIYFGAAGEHTWRDTLNIMGWKVDHHGFDVVFHRSIPDFITSHYRNAFNEFLHNANLSFSEIDRPCSHPGGIKVISALEHVMELPEGTLDTEREVLSEYGNMSSPTVLFVLKKLLQKKIDGRILLTALGPGFSAAFQELTISTNLE